MTIQYQQTGFPWTPGLGNGVVYIGKPVIANPTTCLTLWWYCPPRFLILSLHMLVPIEDMHISLSDKVRWKEKSICGNNFQCCNKISLSILLHTWIFFTPASKDTCAWYYPHNKALLIDVCNRFWSKLAGTQDFAKLCEMVVDDMRIACISMLTVDATGEFNRKDRVSV